MLCPASNIAPGPVLLCHPTGGGKSLVRDTFAVAYGGITWCISPLLSLAADQVTKLQQQAALSSIVAIHLEKHTQDASKLRQLCLQLASIPNSSSSTIIVFSSPQFLVDNLLVRNLFCTLSLNHDDSKKNGLTLLAIDEVHLFAQFGLYFRDEFLQLRASPCVWQALRWGY
jgi:superfamily II DNA helicase RecQ